MDDEKFSMARFFFPWPYYLAMGIAFLKKWPWADFLGRNQMMFNIDMLSILEVLSKVACIHSNSSFQVQFDNFSYNLFFFMCIFNC